MTSALLIDDNIEVFWTPVSRSRIAMTTRSLRGSINLIVNEGGSC